MPEEQAQAQDEQQPKKKRKIPFTLVAVLVVAVVEGAAFYGVTKMFGGGPEAAHGMSEGDDYTEGEDPTVKPETTEIVLLDGFRVPNDKRGQAYMYDIQVVLKVRKVDEQLVNDFVESHKGEISDRVARIIRAADPSMLNEPDLKALRLQVSHTLTEMLGQPEAVLEVLIPKCVPMRIG